MNSTVFKGVESCMKQAVVLRQKMFTASDGVCRHLKSRAFIPSDRMNPSPLQHVRGRKSVKGKILPPISSVGAERHATVVVRGHLTQAPT